MSEQYTEQDGPQDAGDDLLRLDSDDMTSVPVEEVEPTEDDTDEVVMEVDDDFEELEDGELGEGGDEDNG